TVAFGTPALQGGWHNMTYTQSGAIGTLYIDGMPLMTGDITKLPSASLPIAGQTGSLYNWIGRSCYPGDVYLRKTLVYDIRLYKTALTDEQIQTSLLNVGSTISALDVAYLETPSALLPIYNSPYKVISIVGGIKILGLTGADKVSVYDIAGRQMKFNNPTQITANAGVYIVRVNNYVTKLIVR
ncbi:MAG: hypothetical protein WCJ61_06060, partial [Paludibacter sp.]